jgi:6-phosphofructokinase 1
MPEAPRGIAIVGQSGGPTAVINESLVGVALETRKYPQIEGCWGARHGVKGIFGEDFADLHAETRSNLLSVAKAPSAALGSARHKPSPDDCKAIFEVFKKRNVRYFFYIGGNDSAETAHIISEVAREQRYDLRVTHVPKTIDNDLVGHDHCPGYGSAARFVAKAMLGDDLDNASLPGVKINVLMGRNAGFLTAASALARQRPGDGPHLIYLPERGFSLAKFAADVKAVYDRLGRCMVAVSEGVHDEDGVLFAEKLIQGDVDSHGNKQLSGTGALGDHLVGEVKKAFGNPKLRARADTYGYLQRSYMGARSLVDAAEARWVGEQAVAQAVLGGENGSMAIVRRPGPAYEVDLKLVPLESVAQKTRRMPDEWINEAGNDVTQGFLDYLLPLVGEGMVAQVGRLNFIPVKS